MLHSALQDDGPSPRWPGIDLTQVLSIKPGHGPIDRDLLLLTLFQMKRPLKPDASLNHLQ